ncbi:rhamnan synthesis F family protein [Amphritea pacifica]|uniref:Glycosyltransferase n=1 Tax=Amphritea pacifica TaxID=2811233 RepID=A0ABS2W661_9GAMM|nr:rhamnan synthesis F family protein [Amphritea pacifica]MBN0986997.1 glycosyltransferase [Amphritea pacifica]
MKEKKNEINKAEDVTGSDMTGGVSVKSEGESGKELSKDLMAHYYHIINSKGLDWSHYIEMYNLDEDDDPIAHYILNWQRCPLIIPAVFDSAFYVERYQDIRESGENPLVHFIEHGENEARIPYSSDDISEPVLEPEDEDPDFVLLTSCNQIDWGEYKANYCPDTVKHPANHYLQNWDNLTPVFSGFFDTSLYYALYPDIRNNLINPLLHYIKHGISEGRIGWIEKQDYLEAGGREFDPSLKTLIVCAHETSYTGAPIVALEIARRFNANHNIVTVGLRKGEMHNAFLSTGFLHINFPHGPHVIFAKQILGELLKDYKVDAAVLNSVESLNFLDAAAYFEIPTVSLIHEYADYTLPRGKISRAIYTSDVVIYPAESIKLSGLDELKETTALRTEPNHIIVKPQGSIKFDAAVDTGESEASLRQKLKIPQDGIVIAGAGYVQQRKGVDWFFETCYYLLKRMRSESDPRAEQLYFVWIGDGFSSEDMAVSVWLSAFLKRAGIENRCYFSGHVDSVSKALKEVDLYLLTSRLDPFPNVAIDALDADCSIGCFESASGIADFLNEYPSRSVIAPYGDCYALADQVFENFETLTDRNGVNSSLCEEKLCFSDYTQVLESAIESAITKKSAIQNVIAENAAFKSRFDGTFYGMDFCDGDRQHHFLSLLQKGIVFSKPYPGSAIQSRFRVYSYSDDQSFSDYVTSVFADSENTREPVLRLPSESDELFSGKIAIQFHVYYKELIAEYAHYFSHLIDHDVDLFVSHVEPLTDAEVELLRGSVSGKLYLDLVDNCGRDILPFHRSYCQQLTDQYEVVGHFHTKKSVDCVGGIGDRWRTYLLQNLLGGDGVAKQVLSIFNDSKVGLVYAEDRHCVDEGTNMPYIVELTKKMGLQPQVEYYSYPLGTMFWARTQALAPLLKVDKSTFRLEEPIAYDGSVLHAFERIIPQIVESTGASIQKVYLAGTDW